MDKKRKRFLFIESVYLLTQQLDIDKIISIKKCRYAGGAENAEKSSKNDFETCLTKTPILLKLSKEKAKRRDY
jgi:hypothetical protein